MAAPKAYTYRVGSGFALWTKTWSEPVHGLSKPTMVKNWEHSVCIVTPKGHGRSETICIALEPLAEQPMSIWGCESRQAMS